MWISTNVQKAVGQYVNLAKRHKYDFFFGQTAKVSFVLVLALFLILGTKAMTFSMGFSCVDALYSNT